jgi:N-acetylglutamate synthase-like GNAT family acetyltransferase
MPAVRKLVERTGTTLPTAAGKDQHLLVLDAPEGGIAACALLVIDGKRGHLVRLAVAEPFAGSGVEDRMIGVAEAMCTAFGASTLDVVDRVA